MQCPIDSGPAEGSATNDSTPTFTFSSSEPNSTFECRVSGGTFTSCASPRTIDALGDGPRSFEVRAVDNASNPDPTPASRAFTVDTTAPDTTISKPPKKLKAKGKKAKATFKFSSEAGATFACKLDNAAFSPCTSPKTYKLTKGKHTFQVTATDSLGNADPTAAKANVKVVRKKKRK